MKRAAGILFITKAGRVLLMRRAARAEQDADYVNAWAFPGGGIEGEETPEEAARREVQEETGLTYTGPLKLWTRRVRDEIDFTTFVAVLEDEFKPTLNDEHDAYGWVPRAYALTSKANHPGAYVALARFDMDELGVAKAIRDGELTSPQYYNKNLMLIAIRITGTGLSYRGQHKEYVWRDASLYMNQEFLERCNGLEVIFHHPDKSLLNETEYRNRIAGSIFVPYLKPDEQEVWGIAKIRDMEAAKLLETEVMSTSPAVLCLGPKFPFSEDGKPILIENKPTLLDHVAILLGERGVWDKGGPLTGVESIDAVPEGPSPLDVILRAMKINEMVSRVS
jgi:8-oxo-dGTP pyrophosphatase MutT (NUDIX family)